MEKLDVNLARLDEIVKKTINAIDSSKNDLSLIAMESMHVCSKIESEYRKLKSKVSIVITDIGSLEDEISQIKETIDYIKQNSSKYSNEEVQKIYEKSSSIRSQLILKRHEEQLFIKKRNDLEMQLKDTLKTLNKAESVIENITLSLDLLTDDLQKMSQQIEDIQISQQIGIKIIKAQEDERQRVAREIHDGPAQILSNVVIKSEVCDKLIDIEPTKAREEISKLKHTIIECLEDVKRIVYDLRPLSLEELGLIATLENHTRNFSEETGINIDYTVKNSLELIDSSISLTIFRIVQETLSNVKNHSGASMVKVTLDFGESYIELSVSDNGKGLDLNKLKDRGFSMDHGFGLISMKERLKLLNGSIEIVSFPDEGLSITIKIPFINNNA